MNEEKILFLLRAYGDFLIALHMASKNKIDSTITLVASKHLEPLYTALSPTLPGNVSIRFCNFKIRNNLMAFFTNKYFFSPDNLFEILALRRYIRKNFRNKDCYLEQRKRISLFNIFAGHPFKSIISDQNVYKAYADFFSIPLQQLENISFEPRKNGMNILVVPEARQGKRMISNDIIQKIIESYRIHNATVTVAYFKAKKNDAVENSVVYKGFSELKELITAADLFIGGDSMPVHMAQMLGKPHYILHPRSVKNQFFTPFSIKHTSSFTFEDLSARKSFLPDE